LRARKAAVSSLDGHAGIVPPPTGKEITPMRKTVLSLAFLGFAAAPALAMDGGCNWGAKQLNAKATEAETTRSAAIERTTIGERVKADEIVTAEAPKAEATKQQ
jgi:hypothetical protein